MVILQGTKGHEPVSSAKSSLEWSLMGFDVRKACNVMRGVGFGLVFSTKKTIRFTVWSIAWLLWLFGWILRVEGKESGKMLSRKRSKEGIGSEKIL